jgi:glutaconate CoA-transferase subunit B
MRLPGKGPTAVITDLGILTPDPVTRELTLTSLHPGVTAEKVVASTGWPLQVAPQLHATEPPTETELTVLRDLYERTARAHAGSA